MRGRVVFFTSHDGAMLIARRLVEDHIQAYGMVPHPDRMKDAIATVIRRGASDDGRVTGCINDVEEAACLIWAELNPNEVMGDDDVPHYEAAAKAVLARFSPSNEGAGS